MWGIDEANAMDETTQDFIVLNFTIANTCFQIDFFLKDTRKRALYDL